MLLTLRFGASVMLVATTALAGGGRMAGAGDWPQFRGPSGDGHAESARAPLQFSPGDAVAWTAELPGKGYSSPIVQGTRVWVTSAVVVPASDAQVRQQLEGNPQARSLQVAASVDLHVICLDRRTGSQRYDTDVFHVESPKPIQNFNSHASPTPVVEGNRLYCDFGAYGTACLDAETGGEVWKRTIEIEHFVGPGSSPVLCGDLLVLVRDGGYHQFVIAVDKRTGKTVWKTPRPPIDAVSPQMKKAFCTPLLVDAPSGPQLIVPGAQWVVSYDPATGREIWRVSYGSGFSNVPRPVYADGVVFVCTGFMRPSLWAIRVDGRGDVSETHVLWKHARQVPRRSSPILVDDQLYMVSDNGIASCLDAKTGESRWQERLGDNYSASPVLCDGRLYFFSEEGKVTVLKPGREFAVLAQSRIDGHLMATPAFVDEAVIVRTDADVICFR